MKVVNKLVILFVINVNCVFGYFGELRFFIDDDFSSNYKIVATRINLNEPIFGVDFMMIEGDAYDSKLSDSLAYPYRPPFDYFLGFDYVRDIGSVGWPTIGEGKYEFSIYRNNVLVHRFKINLLHYVGAASPDIEFEYTYSTGVLRAIDAIVEIVEFDEMLYSWLILGYNEQDLSGYENPVEILNLGNGILNYNITTKLESATYGFPYDNFSVGTEFNTGEVINFWRGAKYTLSVVQTSFSRNDTTFNFRHWDNYNVLDNPAELKILSETDKIRTMFYPTQPLTVTNYLEGGTSSDNFEIIWQEVKPAQSYNYGSQYNAFNYQLPTNDQYTIKALPITDLRYGTSWTFFNWNTGSYQDTIKNIKLTAPKLFTANYKGHFRADNINAYSSNSQQKTVRDDNGYYHTVYISMGVLWYTKSVTTDFGGEWTKEENILPYDYDGTAKNPALDFYGNNLIVVYEFNQTTEPIGTFLQLVMINMTTGGVISDNYDRTPFPSTFFGYAKPVIAYTNGEIYVAYKESASSTLKFWRKYQDGIGNWVTAVGNIPYTTANSSNVTIADISISNDLHLVWQEKIRRLEGNSLMYIYSYLSGTVRSYSSTTLSTISSNSGYSYNLNPSISLYSTIYPIVSWTGKDVDGTVNRTVVRPKASSVWGSFFITG